jgi:hypothetical protein
MRLTPGLKAVAMLNANPTPTFYVKQFQYLHQRDFRAQKGRLFRGH